MPDPKHSDAVKELVAAGRKFFDAVSRDYSFHIEEKDGGTFTSMCAPSNATREKGYVLPPQDVFVGMHRALRAVEEEMRPKPRWTGRPCANGGHRIEMFCDGIPEFWVPCEHFNTIVAALNAADAAENK